MNFTSSFGLVLIISATRAVQGIYQLIYKLHRLAEEHHYGPFQLDGDWISHALLVSYR